MTMTGSVWTRSLSGSVATGDAPLFVREWWLGAQLTDTIVNGLFAVIVFTAVMAVLLNVYGEVVLAAAVLLAIWLAVDVFGPTSLLAILLIMVAASYRIIAAMTAADLEDAMPRQLVPVLDELLTDREEQDDQNQR